MSNCKCGCKTTKKEDEYVKGPDRLTPDIEADASEVIEEEINEKIENQKIENEEKKDK